MGYFIPPRSVYRDLNTSSIGVTVLFTHLVIAVQHLTVQRVSSQLAIQSEQNVTPSGYKNSTTFVHKSFKSCLSTSQELEKFQSLGQKMFT